MAQYDGSIRIGTGIDTKGLKDGKKELEAESKKLGESVSKSVNENIQIDSKKIENALDAEEKRIEKLAQRAVERAKTVQESVPVPQRIDERGSLNQGYDKNAIKFIDEYAIKTDEHFNQLRIDVEEYSKTLKELQNQGKFFGDEDYDKVYLAWKNATDAVRSYQAELNKQTTSGQEKIAEQEARAAEKREAAQRRAEEQAERALQKENARIQKQVENEAKVSAKEEEKRAKEIAAIQAQEEEEKRIAQIRENAVINNGQIIQTLEQIKQIEQEIVDLKKAGVTEGYKDYDDRIQELSRLRQEVKDYNSNVGRVKEGYKTLGDTAKKSFAVIGNMLKKANSHIDSFGRKIKEIAQRHMPHLRRETDKSSSSFSKFNSRLKSLLSGIFIFNVISAGFRKMFSGIGEGFKNFYSESSAFSGSIDNMRQSLSYLQNSFAAAFAPIVEVAIPYIQKLINYMSSAVNAIAQLIAALFGKKTYTKAVGTASKAMDSVGSSADKSNKTIGNTSSALNGVADSAKEAQDALEGYLSPLDEINKYKTDKGNSSFLGDMSGGGIQNPSTGSQPGNAAGDQFGEYFENMFEEIPIDGIFDKMADKIKDVFSKLFAPLKEAWNREGKFVMDSWKSALKEVWNLIKSVGSDFLEVWQQEKTIKVFEDILHIVGDIGQVVKNLVYNFRLAWEENETGKRILEGIRDVIGVIVANVRHAADATVEWAKNINFTPLLTKMQQWIASMVPVMDNLSGIVTDFYEHVLLPLGKWVLEKGLPDLLQVFIDFNNKVDWEALRTRLAEFWQHLEPFAEKVGEGLIIFVGRLADALANFINSPAFESFLTMLENWMDNAQPDKIADALEFIAKVLVGLKIALLGFSAISAIKGVFDAVKSFLAIFGAGGAGATAAGGISNTSTALLGFVGVMGEIGLAVGVVSAAYKLLTGHMEELAASFGRSTDQARRLEERYNSSGGAARFAKDAVDTLKNGIEGYGFAADNCVGSGVALEKAMEDISDGAIFTDSKMSELQKRFSLTSEDMEMLRQEMLDANPELRDLADNFEFLNDASVESLQEIYYGMQDVSNGIYDANDASSYLYGRFGELTDTSKKFFESISNGTISIDEYTSAVGGARTSVENLNKDVSKSSDGMKSKWSDTLSNMQSKSSSALDSIKHGFQSVLEWIQEKIKAIKDAISGIFGSSKKSGGGFGKGSSFLPFSAPRMAVHPAIAALSDIPIPGYATGQVIPTSMKRHLAILGDNTRETEVVSPLSTIRQALREEAMSLGLVGASGNSNQTIIIKQYLDGKQVAQSVIKEGKVQQMSTGNNMFLLGTP